MHFAFVFHVLEFIEKHQKYLEIILDFINVLAGQKAFPIKCDLLFSLKKKHQIWLKIYKKVASVGEFSKLKNSVFICKFIGNLLMRLQTTFEISSLIIYIKYKKLQK